jgi:hypothetical protein
MVFTVDEREALRAALIPAAQNTLQVDLAFWSSAEFGATGPTFRLALGTANERGVPRRLPVAS